MNRELEIQLMKDSEIVVLLKSLILEKASRHEAVLKVVQGCPDSKIDQILSGPATEADIRLIFERFEADLEIKRLEIDLANMCYALNSNKTDHKNITDWDRAYEHATCGVSIDRVVSFLLGIDRFNRNIKCPFHDDGKASLKVYVKNNRFVCFGCGIRGSPIDFVMYHKNCSFREAVLFLSNL